MDSEFSGRGTSGDQLMRAPRSPVAAAVAPSRQGAEIVLDLSQLLSRLAHWPPADCDRVELAYARALKALAPDRLCYAALHPSGAYGRLAAPMVEAFLDQTEQRWESLCAAPRLEAYRLAARSYWTMRPQPVPAPVGHRVLLQVSPHQLHRPRIIARKLRRESARFICLAQNLAPAAHPQYARPGREALGAQQLATIEALADGLLLPSRSGVERTLDVSGERRRPLRTRIERLGVELRLDPARYRADQPPYFVCLGTIEPHANHLLLLNVWHSIVAALGREQAPRLLLVGRRGWQHRPVTDMLKRCSNLRGIVQERPPLPDRDLRDLLRGARAVLTPAFDAESTMTITTALASGAPVLASGIAPHREAGGTIPDYIDPIDGDAWRRAILSYQAAAHPRRLLQLARIAAWRPLTWQEHVGTALSLIEEVVAC